MIIKTPLVERIVLRQGGFYNVLFRYNFKRAFTKTTATHNHNITVIFNLNNYKSSFPNDFMINNEINQYSRLHRNKLDTQCVKIGIIYENEQTRNQSRILESLLADPLASEFEIWLDKISSRSHNSLYSYNQEVVIDEKNNKFEVLLQYYHIIIEMLLAVHLKTQPIYLLKK